MSRTNATESSSQAEKLLNAKDRIPYGSIRGEYVYNFWQDAEHVRGIMRRTTPESYRVAKPEWETVLDIDALAKAEDENWVYKGTAWLAPDYERCLIKLSRGGTDASVHREFDTVAKRAEGGFAAGGRVRRDVAGPRHAAGRHRLGRGIVDKSDCPAWPSMETRHAVGRGNDDLRGTPWTWHLAARDGFRRGPSRSLTSR